MQAGIEVKLIPPGEANRYPADSGTYVVQIGPPPLNECVEFIGTAHEVGQFVNLVHNVCAGAR